MRLWFNVISCIHYQCGIECGFHCICSKVFKSKIFIPICSSTAIGFFRTIVSSSRGLRAFPKAMKSSASSSDILFICNMGPCIRWGYMARFDYIGTYRVYDVKGSMKDIYKEAFKLASLKISDISANVWSKSHMNKRNLLCRSPPTPNPPGQTKCLQLQSSRSYGLIGFLRTLMEAGYKWKINGTSKQPNLRQSLCWPSHPLIILKLFTPELIIYDYLIFLA